MAVSSLPKDVATRLFKMLAVDEQAANAVKRDHASYAKLNLLTQQMNLLKHQAVGVVEKSVAQAEYDEGAKRLVNMLAVNESTALAIKSSPVACAKLSILAEQVGLLQAQAQEAVDE